MYASTQTLTFKLKEEEIKKLCRDLSPEWKLSWATATEGHNAGIEVRFTASVLSEDLEGPRIQGISCAGCSGVQSRSQVCLGDYGDYYCGPCYMIRVKQGEDGNIPPGYPRKRRPKRPKTQETEPHG